MEHPMQKLNDLSRSLAPLEPDGPLIAVIEMSQSSWLVAGIVPGVERQPLKKLAADEIALLKVLHRRHPARTKRAVVPVGLGASVLARYGYARCVNNVGLNAACPQPTRQPETIPASLEGDCSAFDPASWFLGFLAPSMQ